MKKDKTKKDIEIQMNKKDSNELYSGKYKTQVFADKKDKLEKEHKKTKQNKYTDEKEDA
ncbi:MAG: hypothetical protein U0354_01990 [Candidatus Sericytochromatia bacterium]